MRILVIQETPLLGGAEAYVLGLVRELVKRGHQVTVWTSLPDHQENLQRAGATTEPPPGLGDFYFLRSRISFVRFWLAKPFRQRRARRRVQAAARQHDAVYLVNLAEKLLLTQLFHAQGTPVFWVEFAALGPLARIYKKVLAREYARQAQYLTAAFTISEHSQREIQAEGLVTPKKMYQTYAGATPPPTTETAARQKKAQAIRRQHGSKHLVLGLSRLVPEKGAAVLVRAIPHVLKKVPDTTFLIAGEGPYQAELAALIRAIGVEDRAKLLGYTSDRWALSEACDVFVFPTQWESEGFGIVSVEAMLLRKPVVASRLGPVPEIVIDGQTGYLFPPGNERALAEKIISVLQKPAPAQKIAKQGEVRARQLFSDAHVAEVTEKALLESLGRSGAAAKSVQ